MEAIEKYMKQVKRKIHTRDSKSKRFLEEFETSLSEYDKDGSCSYEDLVARFGEPEKVANDYSEGLFETSGKPVAGSNKIVKLLVCAVVIMCIVYMAVCIYCRIDAHGKFEESTIKYDKIRNNNYYRFWKDFV